MDLQRQQLVDSLVKRHAEAFAYLHHDLKIAVPEVGSRWADRYTSPADMHGMVRCASVRQTLLSIFDEHGAKSFPTLAAHEGPACSIVLSGGRGVRIRVRHWPSDHLGQRVRVVSTPPARQAEAAALAAQQALDLGLPVKILPAPVLGAVELCVLWWADRDEAMLEGVSLAAVHNIDDASQVQILAEASLPPAKRRPTAVSSVTKATVNQLDDFEDFEGDAAGTGSTTSA
jgi:hypothetical protein